MKQIATKVGLSVLTAITGGAAWMIAEPGAQSIMSAMFKPVTPQAEAEAPAVPAAVTGLKDTQAANTSLATAMEGLLNIARAANRPDIDLVALTAARARVSELNAKMAGLNQGDEAALQLLKSDINDIALSAARTEIAGLSVQADKIASSLRNDFQTTEKELAGMKKELDADSIAAKASFEASMTAIKSAVVMSVGSDAMSVVSAASNAEQGLVTLTSIKSSGANAFTKAKRDSFNTNLKTVRELGAEIATLSAGKKANLLASREKKADAKYLQDTAAWAKARVAELEQASAKLSTLDRKALTQAATLAAGTSSEFQNAIIHVREVSARLATK
ncbi:MAG TPA: hypothetical protein VFV70_00570 [Hyphomonadaceae bacterium]|nr:hypothetical protein [Hyphomonadaceae bacterium]